MRYNNEAEVPKIVDHNGHERRLGLLPPDDEMLSERRKCKSFTEALRGIGLDLIPESQWRDIDYGDTFGLEFITNQRNSSGCVGWSAAGAETETRFAMGMPFELLSGAFLYAQINGNRDAGSYILDAQKAGVQYGYCLQSEFDYPNLFRRQIPQSAYASALTRQATNSVTISSDEEFFTAIMLGFFPQMGVQAGGSFERFDSNGVSAVRGGWANHSVRARGMKKINGNWCAYMPNSWGTSWGPFRNGCCYLDRRGLVLDDAFVHMAGEWDPNKIPTPVS